MTGVQTCALPIFNSSFKFALDWDTMYRLAARKGRFVCEEKPLLCYRVHDGAETKACIEDDRRPREELAMYRKIWPGPIAGILMHFYKRAYASYEECGSTKCGAIRYQRGLFRTGVKGQRERSDDGIWENGGLKV